MGRLTRNCRAAKLDAENISPNNLEKRNQKVKQISSNHIKSILGDRTNLRETNKNIRSPKHLINQNIPEKAENNLKIDTKIRKRMTKGMSNVPLKSKLNLKCDIDDEKQSDSDAPQEKNIYVSAGIQGIDSSSNNMTPLKPTNPLKPLAHNLQASKSETQIRSNRVLRGKRNLHCNIENKGKENKTTTDESHNKMSNGMVNSQLKSIINFKSDKPETIPVGSNRILKEKNNLPVTPKNCIENSIGSDTSINDLSFKVTSNGALKLVTNNSFNEGSEESQNEPIKSLRTTRNCSSVYSRKGKDRNKIDFSKTNDLPNASPKSDSLCNIEVNKKNQNESTSSIRGKNTCTSRNNVIKLNNCVNNTILKSRAEKLCKPTKEKKANEETFLGFEDEDPFLTHLMQQYLNNCQLKTPSKSNHLPVYKTIKSTPNKRPIEKKEDLLNLYEFEIDENEPVVKKGKRRRILKMGSKMFRTYKPKKKVVAVLSPLNLSDQGTKCSKVKTRAKRNPRKCNDTISSQVSENVCQNTSVSSSALPSQVGNTSFIDDLESSIENALSVRSEMYSPKPYESPKRDSPCVPILRSSVPPASESPKSLNTSAYSSKCNSVVNSPFSSHFGTPAYIGSSTPIYKHWVENTNNGYSNINDVSIKNYDVSNCFGFDDSLIEEPFVSPIKMYTPGKTPTRVPQVKPSPQKLTHQQVSRMLKFGPEAKDLSLDDSAILQNSSHMEELLPDNFFHDGSTPPYEYSPGHSPSYLFDLKNKKKNNKGQKKRVNIKDNATVIEDETHHSFLDKSQNKTDITGNKTVLSNNRTMRARSRMARGNNLTALPAINETREETSRLDEPEHSKDFDISSFEQVTKKARRSYERPEYLRVKKYGDEVHPDMEDEPEPVQETTYVTPTKTHPKKKNELSKKEKQELEKWAKAFNEQCMAVESFNLVVE